MTSIRLAAAATTVVALGALAAACGDDSGNGATAEPETTSPTGSPAPSSSAPDERVPDTPLTGTPDPSQFGPEITNEFLPYKPGTRWVYHSVEDGEVTHIVTTVTHKTRVVQGVTCVVVHDVESTPDGEVLEDTFDWYAQDADGNVWYFGEDTTSYDEGKPSKEGSWEAGVDGAQAGIIMLADPQVGDVYQQEYYEGEAEDQGEVVDIAGSHPDVDASYGLLLITADTNPLEPRLLEHKYYAPGVGVVREETLKGGHEEVVLVSMKP